MMMLMMKQGDATSRAFQESSPTTRAKTELAAGGDGRIRS
jgi:hypothetical protein